MAVLPCWECRRKTVQSAGFSMILWAPIKHFCDKNPFAIDDNFKTTGNKNFKYITLGWILNIFSSNWCAGGKTKLFNNIPVDVGVLVLFNLGVYDQIGQIPKSTDGPGLASVVIKTFADVHIKGTAATGTPIGMHISNVWLPLVLQHREVASSKGKCRNHRFWVHFVNTPLLYVMLSLSIGLKLTQVLLQNRCQHVWRLHNAWSGMSSHPFGGSFLLFYLVD